jgi:hypothetical protein
MLRPKLSPDDYSLVVRTDFSDDVEWQRVCAAIQSPQTEDGFQASVECISASICDGLSPEEVCRLLPDTDAYLFVFIVDARTLGDSEHPILVVDTEDSSLQFRVVPREAWAVENNLRLANMGFDDFEAALGEDGVYRGMKG